MILGSSGDFWQNACAFDDSKSIASKRYSEYISRAGHGQPEGQGGHLRLGFCVTCASALFKSFETTFRVLGDMGTWGGQGLGNIHAQVYRHKAKSKSAQKLSDIACKCV